MKLATTDFIQSDSVLFNLESVWGCLSQGCGAAVCGVAIGAAINRKLSYSLSRNWRRVYGAMGVYRLGAGLWKECAAAQSS